MILKSLDPRVTRLSIELSPDESSVAKDGLDQFETYEAFVQSKEGKPFEHAGPVHAPNEEMAFLFAKEQYSRRGMFCNAICVIKTENIKVSEYTDNGQDIYNLVTDHPSGNENESFEIFHLMKRGKQHKHEGSVLAKDFDDAMAMAKKEFQSDKPVFNVWIVKSAHIMASEDEDKDIWDTLKEKQYREATDYKAADKIKAFKENQA
ncbi:MAG: phenylacetic acid degradation b [Cytophagales bacterium CG12_big_fil_rev_8_21_14_0_65_40_12]|nr:MAG: phenylacetic acid degradation b [Cytophagales bacterium CG12_big_fil_rev_8_21_14_0_65_40_12]PIW02943.1 MAG: phenylacetic acid degradation b [Cytophagales bacterium CG17_big_fil_post_rev_8_21_14_2_50_40_13]